MKQSITQYLLKQEELFFHNYKIAKKNFDVDAVHDMRVAVKRINTINRLLNYKEKANFRLKKCLLPIRFVYKKFGDIRDFHVLKTIVGEYQNTSNIDLNMLVDYCEQRVNHEILLLKKYLKDFQYLKMKRSFRLIEFFIKSKSHELLKSKIDQFKEECKNQLQTFSNKLSNSYDLHKARKKVKDIGYLEEIKLINATGIDLELKLYKQLGSMLGTWHDRDVLLNFLKEHYVFFPFNYNVMDELFALIEKEKSKLENECFGLTGF